jgi:hypothetical protein
VIVNERLDLPVFECISSPDPRLNKRPARAHGFYDAKRIKPSPEWDLVGVRSGEASGISGLDIDPKGEAWYRENFDALPLTRAHETQRRGVHLLFKHAPGLGCSTERIALGVDVKAQGGYFIWWPRQGLPFEDHPICGWPDWLLKEALTRKPSEGKPSAYKRTASPPSTPYADLPSFTLEPTISVQLRSKYLLQTLEHAQPGERHRCILWVSCRFGNMWGERKIEPDVAERLVFSASRSLFPEGRSDVLRTIRDGLKIGREEWRQAEKQARAERKRARDMTQGGME